MTARRLVVIGLIALVGCGDDGPAEPESHAIPTGVYEYSFEATRGVNQQWRFTGTLTITSATEDRVTGTWDVQSQAAVTDAVFDEPVELGGWNLDAYLVAATFDDGSTSGFINHRVAEEDGEVVCRLAAWTFFFGTVDSDSGQGTCSLTGPL